MKQQPSQAQAKTQIESRMAGGGGEEEGESMMDKVALECGGDISASQEGLLARSSFLGGDGDGTSQPQEEEEEEEEVDVFSTPPLTQDPITMCTLPFTQSQSPPPPNSPPPPTASDDDGDMALVKTRRKPRVCTRKVRGARLRTPTPSPPKQHQHQPHLDPLYRAVLMIPTTTTATARELSVEDLLALARQRGLF